MGWELYWQYYIMGIILLPAIIFAIWAQTRVQTTFNKYAKLNAKSGITTHELMEHLIKCVGLQNLSITHIKGNLTDHYNSRTKTLALSETVYNSSSISALGVAAHEFGHALQDRSNYAPLKFRQILIPITNFASGLLLPFIMIGLILGLGVSGGGIIGDVFLWVGVGIFGIAVLANLVTLPVEYNASNRAIQVLRDSATLDEVELQQAKKVLNAAALTYVASLLISILNLLRFLIVILGSRRR